MYETHEYRLGYCHRIHTNDVKYGHITDPRTVPKHYPQRWNVS
jgi:hypothetical protein